MSKLQLAVPTWNHELVIACAYLSEWVYHNEDPLMTEFEKLIDIPYSPSCQLTAFTAVKAPGLKALIVVHRGTEESTDCIADAHMAPHPLYDTGINVHGGIYTLVASDVASFAVRLRGRLEELGDNYSVCFTGHSLGGAIATLMLLEFELARFKLSPQASLGLDQWPARAITFGAPMVLHTVRDHKVALVEAVGKQALNFVNGNDTVPCLPGLHTFLEDNGPAALSLFRLQPLWFKRMLPTVTGWVEPLRQLAKEYRHFTQLAQISGSDVELVPDPQRLLVFNQTAEDTVRNSIFQNHSAISYCANLWAAAEQRQDSADDANKVARLEFRQEGFFRKRFVREFKLSPHWMGIANIRHSIVEVMARARVASFCGNSRTGKSFIIRKLQALDGESAVGGPFVCELQDYGATTGDVSLWKWSSGWLLDCEGTCGSEVPATMGKIYRKIEKELDRLEVKREKREDAVRRFFPPLCISVSSVFCFVIQESFSNTAGYHAVCDFASSGWDRVESAVRPGLVIIQNQVGFGSLVDPAGATERFLRHDREGKLTSLFQDVRVVQLPSINHDNAEVFVRSKQKTVQQLFDERLQLLADTLKDLTAQHLEKQIACNAVLTEVTWLRLLPDVCRAFAEGQKVSIAQILPKLMERPLNFFQDVVDAAQLLLSPRVLSFRDRSDLEQKVLQVLDAVRDHTASLMAQVAFSEGVECAPH